MVSIVDGFGDAFVEIFSKITPEAVEHEFGHSFASRIFLEGSSVMASF